MPNPLMYIAALFDKRLSFSFLKRNLGRRRKIDNSLLKRDLVPEPRSGTESIRDTAQSFIDLGFL